MKLWQKVIVFLFALIGVAMGIAVITRSWLNARELKICYKTSAVLLADVAADNGYATSTKFIPKTTNIVGGYVLLVTLSIVVVYIVQAIHYVCQRKSEDKALQRQHATAMGRDVV